MVQFFNNSMNRTSNEASLHYVGVPPSSIFDFESGDEQVIIQVVMFFGAPAVLQPTVSACALTSVVHCSHRSRTTTYMNYCCLCGQQVKFFEYYKDDPILCDEAVQLKGACFTVPPVS